jgi:hypothetical protein
MLQNYNQVPYPWAAIRRDKFGPINRHLPDASNFSRDCATVYGPSGLADPGSAIVGVSKCRESSLNLLVGVRLPRRSKKTQRFTTRAGVKTVLHPLRRNIDDMHRPVALAGDKQFVAAERHVHRLASDLDGDLPAE